MTLDSYREVAERALDPFVRAAIAVGLTPDGVSVVAFLFALTAGASFGFGGMTPELYLAGAALIFLNGVLDLLDGMVARATGTESQGGDLLDHVLDRYADIAALGGLAAGTGRWLVGFIAVTGVLMTSYLGTQAQAVGLERVYGGLVGRADRLAIIGIVTGIVGLLALTGRPVPAFRGLSVIAWLLVFFAVVGHITALQRFYGAMRALR